jgi:hypothetical protein
MYEVFLFVYFFTYVGCIVDRVITLFSWNEWVEGGYLLPDMCWEYGYLEAVKSVVGGEDGSIAIEAFPR